MASKELNSDGTQIDKHIAGHSTLPSGLMPPKNFGELYAQAPNVMVCFKRSRERSNGSGNGCTNGDRNSKSKHNEKRDTSRELRASILYVGCDCEKRNGLQDQCPRSECQGRPHCLTKPPSCPPSEFAGGKHLTKKTDLFLQRKRAAEKAIAAKAAREAMEAKRAKEKSEKPTRKKEKLHYDCMPIDKLLAETENCPICCKPLDFEEVCYRKPVINEQLKSNNVNKEDYCDTEKNCELNALG